MLSREEFIRESLELNLFFQRIMKEHLFFIETSAQPVDSRIKAQAASLRMSFAELLAQTIRAANGVVSEAVIGSNEFVTPFTLDSEESTARLTGTSINITLTRAELELTSNRKQFNSYDEVFIRALNGRTLDALERVINFQKRLIDMVASCSIFIPLYPELLRHITREAELYRNELRALNEGELPRGRICFQIDFWNNIMLEHAQFIDGLLDPTEEALKAAAQGFVDRFSELIGRCSAENESRIASQSREAAKDIKAYKAAATEGLLRCNIESIIVPLLADHVLREANHFLRILG